MGKKNGNVVPAILRHENISIKGSVLDYSPIEIEEAGYRLEDYFDKVFETAFREINKAFPECVIFRNGVKQ